MRNKELNLLIVDDRPENLLALESLLETLEVNIVKAGSGNEALGYMLEYDFFLVLMDVQMPEMNGFETAELMRGIQKTEHIPIIFVTAISKEQQYVFRGYELGAVDYLFKPIDPIILSSKVKIFMEIYKTHSLLKQQTKLLEEKIEELIQLSESNYKLEKISNYDALTEIHNRRSFDEYISKEWSRGTREKTKLSIIMIDIDFFKQYNDTYGHLQGDFCLQKVAKGFLECLNRASDFVARYGGEEFVILLPSTHEAGAMEVAERVRNLIENLNIKHETSNIANYVTVSLGVNTVTPNLDTNLKEFINGADEALYLAKKEGRNRAASYTGEKSCI